MAFVLDTGPLYAVLDRDDAAHQRSISLLDASNERLVIPSPVLVEVEQLIRARLDVETFTTLLSDIIAGDYHVENLSSMDYARIAQICSQYRDTLVGFVDAAVLAVVERLGETKVVTLDQRHFRMLRPRHIDALQLLPE